jgi:hypothetical protein
LGLARNLSKFKPSSDGLVGAEDIEAGAVTAEKIAEGAIPEVDLQAFANGDAGQPKILGEAFAVIATFPAVTVSASSTYTLVNGFGITLTSGSAQTQDSSFGLVNQFVINNFTGAIRVFSSLAGDFATVEFRILKNGTQVFITSTSTSLDVNADINIVPTDIIRCESRRTAGTGYANAFGTVVKASKRIVAASALKVEG